MEGMEGIFMAKAAAAMSAAFVMGFGALGPALGQGFIGGKACENIGKYPESSSKIQTAMMLAMGIVESSVVFALVIAFLLITYGVR